MPRRTSGVLRRAPRPLLAAVLLLSSAAARASGRGPIVVHLYHTNDVHGWIMARPGPKGGGRPLIGGAPAFKALVDRDKGPKLVLDAGDWWQGTPEGSLTKGRAVAEVFNAVGYDAVEIGNHEFDDGQASLRALIGRLHMPVLAANIYGPDGKRVPWAKPRIILKIAGVKFGIFGLLTSHMPGLEFPRNVAGLTFRREVDEARDQVRALKREGADVIVALTHVGFERAGGPAFEGDQTIAREVPGIDLIVGGHTHTFLKRGWRDPVHGTLIVQAGSYLRAAGIATLKIDPRTRRLISDSDRLVDLRPDRGTDPKVQAAVDRVEAGAARAFAVVIATATSPLARNFAGESGIGSWMADCYRARERTQVAIQPGASIRAGIPAGPVTKRTIFDVMPFDDAVVRLTMTGAQLRRALEAGMDARAIAQVSGAAVRFRPGGPRGGRLVSVAVAGKPLADGETYSVASLDFLYGEGSARAAEAVSWRPTGELARDVLLACAEREGRIAPPPPGRLKALPED
ncbi:MAG: bifunctional metallophosphatase/5'-nucleotidase [Elusimicrobia bacterium]|nr:bifunctional metallophosphatase/5'-nucleotidase [Elusimicrobiota bacterium]